MGKKYLLCLFKQYCIARNLEMNENNFFSEDFYSWVAQNNRLLYEYFEYLGNIGFDYQNEDVIEIGKGRLDSLSKNGIKLISPFAETCGKSNSGLVVIGEGIPLIFKPNEAIVAKERILLTHNPYFESEILNWHLIHNRGDKNISIGMFGSLNDMDTYKKIDLLKKISKKMKDDHSLDFDTDNGNYFCTLNSKRKIKRKILTRLG